VRTGGSSASRGGAGGRPTRGGRRAFLPRPLPRVGVALGVEAGEAEGAEPVSFATFRPPRGGSLNFLRGRLVDGVGAAVVASVCGTTAASTASASATGAASATTGGAGAGAGVVGAAGAGLRRRGSDSRELRGAGAEAERARAGRAVGWAASAWMSASSLALRAGFSCSRSRMETGLA